MPCHTIVKSRAYASCSRMTRFHLLNNAAFVSITKRLNANVMHTGIKAPMIPRHPKKFTNLAYVWNRSYLAKAGSYIPAVGLQKYFVHTSSQVGRLLSHQTSGQLVVRKTGLSDSSASACILVLCNAYDYKGFPFSGLEAGQPLPPERSRRRSGLVTIRADVRGSL